MCQSGLTTAVQIVQIVGFGVGAVVLIVTALQMRTRNRAHLLEVYRQVFSMLDEPPIRDARHYVCDEMHREAFAREEWAQLRRTESSPPAPDHKSRKRHQDRAEQVLRTFDKLGLLVREGRVPVNVVASFYIRPILICWYQLSPYIGSERTRRKQPGHVWEWENLVFNVVIKKVREGRGVWEGCLKHENLAEWLGKITAERDQIERDRDYRPPTRLWTVHRWWW